MLIFQKILFLHKSSKIFIILVLIHLNVLFILRSSICRLKRLTLFSPKANQKLLIPSVQMNTEPPQQFLLATTQPTTPERTSLTIWLSI